MLRNAAQALSAGGQAEVSVIEAGAFVQVEVRDEGVGMSPEQLGTAFQLFVTSRPGGNGLGLGIARQIAIAHRSDIHVPGAGTACRVRSVTEKRG